MRVVITGSESFISRWLKPRCKAAQVEWIGVDTAPSRDPGHVVMDIRDPAIAQAIPEQADALIHLAALSRWQDCGRDPGAAFDVNVGGTLNLLQAAQARKVQQVIFASTEWVYGEGGDGALQTEDSVIDVNRVPSVYALTKVVGERVLSLAHQRTGLPVTVLRFGIVYGPRHPESDDRANWSAVETLFEAVRTQETVEIRGSLQTARRFIHVADVAAGILAALGRRGHEVFNLSGDRPITLRELIEQSAALLNRRPRVIEQNPAAISVHNPDNRKARAVLGWAPAVGLRDGLVTLLPMSRGEVACHTP